MNRPGAATIAIALGFVALAAADVSADENLKQDEGPKKTVQADEMVFFESKVRPILVNRCDECHGPESDFEAGLRVDSLAALVEGGDTGPAIVPGKPAESLLIDAINYGEVYEMPPDGKLPQEEIDILTRWVKIGAPWPNSSVPLRAGKKRNQPYEYSDEEKSYWAFQPPIRPPIPAVANEAWPQREIDNFVLSALEAAELQPAKTADKRTLIRRATYDLHGLPPTPKEIAAFLKDESPKAFECVVDRLLESPRYGEKWGRHWLDVARYADSNGGDQNRVQANAYRYRDYVIRAFNDDKPFDRMILEQLAGDLLPTPDHQTRTENLIATGFLMIGPKPLIKNDDALCEMDVVDEQIKTVTGAFMGLTLGCCRCHDHKFDPLPTADYYALAGIFKSSRTITNYVMRTHRSWTERALGSEDDERLHQKLKKEFDYANDQRRFLGDQKEKVKFYKSEMERVRGELAVIPVAMAVRDGEIADCALHIRGNPLTLGEPVPRSFPGILTGAERKPLNADGSGRLELAQWLASGDHPLTSRVIVNRIWKWHFGEGIVRSTDNFGLMGDRPDNQELLDWLAIRFVDERWSVKAMHRLLMLSSAYQMSSQRNDTAAAVDPENRLLWRFQLRRLEAEEIRDALLLVSGQLDPKMGGNSLSPEFNFELPGQSKKARKQIDERYTTKQRSVYLPVIRSGLFELFKVFDFANPSLGTGSRSETTVAPQALFMMNSSFVRGISESFASRVLRHKSLDDRARVRWAYQLAIGRTSTREEEQRSLDFIEHYKTALEDSGEIEDTNVQKTAWSALCRVILSSNEFIFIE